MAGRQESQKQYDARRSLLSLEKRVTPVATNAGDLRVCLCYPNHYWVAMSNLGFQAVHHIFESEKDVVVERAFLPDDFEIGKREGQWRTFENQRLIGDCDVLGFSLSFETDYPHIIAILNNQGLLCDSPQARDELSGTTPFGIPIIVVGGTAVTLNPEPIADLVDVIALGEAEQMIPEIVATIRAARAQGVMREELLWRLSKIEGLFVPRFHTPQYSESGELTGVTRHMFGGDVAHVPARRFVSDLSAFPTFSRILTPETEFKSMFLTETGRGCEMGCRFCVAGYIYRPVRKRSEEAIAATIDQGLKQSDAIGFVGASVSSHRSIAKLAKSVADRGGRASLSSIMSQKVSRELAASISESEYKTVALAPEAGSERLRRAAGKRVTNEQVISAVKELAEAGIRGFKLYFIAGLPTETDVDLDAIADLAVAVRDVVVEATKPTGKVGWVQLSVNPFIPKASTPFQWEPMLGLKELDSKIARIEARIKGVSNLEMRFEPPRESVFQALLSRGDRRVARYLVLAEREGKDWKWLLQQARKGAIRDMPRLDFYVERRIPFEEILPWEIVDSRVDRRLLFREAMRARHGEEWGRRGPEAEGFAGVEEIDREKLQACSFS